MTPATFDALMRAAEEQPDDANLAALADAMLEVDAARRVELLRRAVRTKVWAVYSSPIHSNSNDVDSVWATPEAADRRLAEYEKAAQAARVVEWTLDFVSPARTVFRSWHACVLASSGAPIADNFSDRREFSVDALGTRGRCHCFLRNGSNEDRFAFLAVSYVSQEHADRLAAIAVRRWQNATPGERDVLVWMSIVDTIEGPIA